MRQVLLLALATACAAALAGERVEVAFVQPEKFTDAGRYWGGDASRKENLAELARHLERGAAPRLSAGQSLSVSITDLDIAGAYEPWRRGAGDVRIVRDVYPPRIELSFRLVSADGTLLKQGERRLRDPFLVGGVRYRDDRLRYEKGLLDDWLERELPATAAAPSPAAR